MRPFLHVTRLATIVLLVAALSLWAALALWYRLPAPEWGKYLAIAAFGVFTSIVIYNFIKGPRLKSIATYALVFLGMLVWWSSIVPPATGNWAPDVARQTTGVIEGDILTLTNVREFEWQSKHEAIENWTTRTYDLSKLETVDVFLSYWSGPQMAHFILSFGFEDSEYLAWTIEVRREIGSGYSPIADLFKEHTIVVLATTERDVVGLRTNFRKEDVHLFRLRTQPERARNLLEEYVRDANELSVEPQWYNSVMTNCTTVVVKMLSAVGDGIPFDWRLIANGFLPEMAYERKTINTDYSISQLRELGSVTPKAQEVGLVPGFSEAIRVGVPKPYTKSE